MSAQPDITIVLVNYNSGHYTAQCLDSIRAASLRLPYEIVLVDNASQDGSADWLQECYPEVNLIRSPENRGISGGNNLGIKAGSGRYVLLLNNDTVVFPGSMELMADFLNTHPEAGAVGGRLLHPDRSFQSSFNDFPSLRAEFLSATRLHLLFNPHHPSHRDCDRVREVDWISSACLMVRRAALEQIGLVDEAFFIYGDEADLQYRLWKAGWKVYFLPGVSTIHYGGRSLNRWKRRSLVYRGKLIFFRKHYGALRTVALRLLLRGLSLTKMVAWSIVLTVPPLRQRARSELSSNLEVLNLCIVFKRRDFAPIDAQRRGCSPRA